MFKVERKVTLLVKPNNSTFFRANAVAIGPRTENLGSNATASRNIAANSVELRYYLRNILGINPESVSSNWDGAVRTYLDSISINVPMSGKEFNIGLIFDIDDTERQPFIEALIKQTAHDGKPIITTSEELAKLVLSTKREDEYYKYATPIDPVAYISWRYCLVHVEVANTIEFINKSTKIRFYLYTDVEDKKIKEQQYDLDIKVMNKQLEVLNDITTVKDILFALHGLNEIIVDVTPETLADKVLLGTELKRIANKHPHEFLAIANDSKVKMKAKIERLIKAGLLRRLTDTTIVVDASNTSIVIGRTLDEAVIYFENEANAAQVSEYIVKYKSLKNNVQ